MATSVVLEPDIDDRLDALARLTGRTKADYIREILRAGIEDIEDARMADEAMERLARGETRTYTSAEVRRDLGLDD